MKKQTPYALIACGLVGVATVCGQIGTATVLGRIQDPTGAVIVNASDELKHLTTDQVVRTAATNAGVCAISYLPVGGYRVEASSAGFKTEVIGDATLEIGRGYRF